MRLALITTTINVPTVLTQWEKSMTDDDIIIIAGDHKSPHDEIEMFLDDNITVPSVYLHPEDQMDWQSSSIIGWNCIQRRNIALLEAIKRKPKYIATIDDDNSPAHERYFDIVFNDFGLRSRDLLTSSNQWYNVGKHCIPNVTHRGFPLLMRGKGTPATSETREERLGVFASLWTGAPDIDAIERIVNDPYVERVSPASATLDKGTWCPFNSQATVYDAEVAPLMFMWPGVGRYDDIWASYLARAVMDHLGYYVKYGHPTVHQNRNPHNLLVDLHNELFGYEHTFEITEILRQIDFISDNLMSCLLKCFVALTDHAALPQQTLHSFNTWLYDLESIA